MSSSLIRIMTVCTGNICRSPMAESVLRDRLEAAGLGDVTVVDSTAITSEEVGNRIDRRAARTLSEAGYDSLPNHRARRVRPEQLRERHLVLPMTAQHARYLRSLLPSGIDTAQAPAIRMYRTFDPNLDIDEQTALVSDQRAWDIADPWYGDLTDFEVTLAQIEAGADAIVEYARSLLGQTAQR